MIFLLCLVCVCNTGSRNARRSRVFAFVLLSNIRQELLLVDIQDYSWID